MTIKQINRPEPPKGRSVCDACGDLGEQGKHTNIMCRLVGWLETLEKNK